MCLACPGRWVFWSKGSITNHLWKRHSLTTQQYEREFMAASGGKEVTEEEDAKKVLTVKASE